MSRTKPHKMSQYPLLSIEQHNAIDLLILGDTDHAVAEQIGVADCIYNQPGLQSAHFPDHIICIYHPAQDRIICN